MGILVSGSRGTAPGIHACRHYQEVLQVAKRRGMFCYVFGPDDLDADRSTVQGYQCDEAGNWIRSTVPRPDVVYNRIPDRTSEAHPLVVKMKRFLKLEKIPFFNPGFLNKGIMYQMILDDDIASAYMPHSVLLQGPGVFSDMIDRYPTIYCKPSGGSLGIGILRIDRTKQGGLELRYRLDREDIVKQFSDHSSLYQFIRRVHPTRHYIVQQGIRLQSYDGAPTDFRVHLHKNGEGNWDVIGIGAKVAGKTAITTHVRSGGYVTNARKVLQVWDQKESDELQSQLETASIDVARALESRMDGYVGELGMDFGIDTREGIWLFEANAKPGRTIFKHESLREKSTMLASHIVEYGTFIARTPFRKGVRVR